MAVMKKKGDKSLPPISTASLPDVIFMILFFFMISTTMRDQELLVRYKLPTATEVQKLEKKSLVSFIHIGQPTLAMQAKFGTAPRIQLNDSYRTEKDILDFMKTQGVDVAKFEKTLRSFGVMNKSRVATQTWQAYQIDSTPMIGVGGIYSTGPHLVGSREETPACIDFLIEEVRKTRR